MRTVSWEKTAAILICTAFGIFAILLSVRYLFPIVVPFLVAWGLALAVRRMAAAVCNRFSISRCVCAACLFILLLSTILGCLMFTFSRLFSELRDFLARLPDAPMLQSLTEGERDLFSVLADRFPFLYRFSAGRERINQALYRAINAAVSALSSDIPRVMGRMLGAFPSVLLGVVITVIAGFYFCVAKQEPLTSVLQWVPSTVSKYLPACRMRAVRLFRGFLRAYLILFLLTFSMVFFGFCLLRVDYAFLLAAVVALVDLLPVLGVGTVLIPWSIFAFLSHRYALGMGLLILYAVALVVRQIAEPRLLGKSLGLSPIASLFATYAGWCLFGFLGMLLGPVVAVAMKSVMSVAGSRREEKRI